METALEYSEHPEVLGQVRTSLSGLMEIESYTWDGQGALTLRGRLKGPAKGLYRTIRSRMEALGYTPFLRSAAGQDELLALPGVAEQPRSRVGLPLLLFCLTVLTVLFTGAFYQYSQSLGPIVTEEQWLSAVTGLLRNPQQLLLGVPFTLTLLGILVTHEMGHYVVGRLRHAPVSLPYFIPMPLPGSIGTMGAVIVQREPLEDRRTILEVGIAGPLAGLVVALPLLLYGLATSHVGVAPSSGYVQKGNSLLYLAAKWLVFGQVLPSNGVDVQLNSVAWGAWIGLLVTMINLLPVGQLDGGHVAYALLGARAHYLSYAMIGISFALGIFVAQFWLVWALLALFLIGPRHPAPLNDITGISRWHIVLGVFGLVMFVLLLTPAPLTPVGG